MRVWCVVLDGVGERDATWGNAVYHSYTPNLDYLRKHGVFTRLYAHGTHVGMPSNQDMGNSEVGHNTLGAGQIIDQGAKLVEKALDSGSLFVGKAWQKVLTHSVVHYIGLLSDGNVHSHIKHLEKLVSQSGRHGQSIRLHLLLDGRDVPEGTSVDFAHRIETRCNQLRARGVDIFIASGGGRMAMTMDRYGADWSMVERGWQAHVEGMAENRFDTFLDGIKALKDQGYSDQTIPAFVVKSYSGMKDGEAVVLFNFRGDRAIQLCQAFEEVDFSKFVKNKNPKVNFFGMMQYEPELAVPSQYLVDPPEIPYTLSHSLLKDDKTQFACSETQKFGHVTYFWNGNRQGKLSDHHETFLEIPSLPLACDLYPWMRASEITEAACQQMKNPLIHFGRINLANGDMVGHTGDFVAACTAMSVLDLMVGRLLVAAKKNGVTLVITADHGNCDEMFFKEPESAPFSGANNLGKTSHSLSQVPLIIWPPSCQLNSLQDPGLANMANTFRVLMGLAEDPAFHPSVVKLTL